jgi:hypothetical protein
MNLPLSQSGRLIVALALGGVLIVSAVVIGDRYWFRAAPQSYPVQLIAEQPREIHDLASMRRVCSRPLEAVQLNADEALVWCDRFWPARYVWKVPRHLLHLLHLSRPAFKESGA